MEESETSPVYEDHDALASGTVLFDNVYLNGLGLYLLRTSAPIIRRLR
jgi:hypothetical protein